MLLEVDNIAIAYNKIEALKGVSLTVDEGEIVAIIGANGAGKTTLINAISGILRPHQGEIRFRNSKISDLPAYQIARRRIIQVPEGRKVFNKLSVLENLEMGAFANTDKNWVARQIELMQQLFPILAERREQPAGTLSGGEQQMLAIARGLMSIPLLLMLDEPSLGLAPMMVIKTLDVLQRLNQQGLTLLLIEQNVHSALNLCARGYVLENGRIVMEGSGEELLNDNHVKEAYLGIV